MMLTRAKAVEMAAGQLWGDIDSKSKFEKPDEPWYTFPHHYGACELRDLLDAIYGGPPSAPDEFLTRR